MRRLSSCAALVIAAFIVSPTLAVSVAATPVRANAATGSLYVTTLPAGADVYVDGIYVGRSPLLVDALGPGRHGVTMTKAGWTLRETDVAVSSGSVFFESERLTASGASGETGTIVVRGVSGDAEFSLDGVRQKTRAPIVAMAGSHKLTISSGTSRTTRDVTVFPDTTTDVLARDGAPAVASHAAASVVAALDEWLPDAVLTMSGKKISLRYEGHVLDGRVGDPTMRVDGESVSYSGPPEMIGGKLYLPLGVLERLSGNVVRIEPKK